LATASEGLDLRKDDPELQRILNDALASARARIATERDAATAVGREAVGTNAFQNAARRQRSADQAQRSGQTATAVRAAEEAIDLFKQAQVEGRRLAQAAEANANAPKTPAP